MGDFSRNTFDPQKHHVGVRLRQGVPLLDADWNERDEIHKHERQNTVRWIAGDGVPKDNDGFRLRAAGQANSFTIEAGRCLVDGWDTVNHVGLVYTAQPLSDAMLAALQSKRRVQHLVQAIFDLHGLGRSLSAFLRPGQS